MGQRPLAHETVTVHDLFEGAENGKMHCPAQAAPRGAHLPALHGKFSIDILYCTIILELSSTRERIMPRKDWIGRLVAYYSRQRSVDKLSLLSDHLLADMGLRRDQLDALRLDDAEAEPRPVDGARIQTSLGVWRYPEAQPRLRGCG